MDRDLILATQSQLLFSQTQLGGASQTDQISGSAVTSDSSNEPPVSKSSDEDNLMNLGKRFIEKDESEFFKERAAKKAKFESRLKLKAKMEKLNDVKIYRKYRVGELPDIEIRYSDIIEPLMALGEQDPKISKVLFSGFLASLLDSIKDMDGEDALIQEFEASISSLISKCNASYAPLTSCILKLFQDFLSVSESICQSVDSRNILSMSIISGNPEIGALCLEKYLKIPQPQTIKKVKMTNQSSCNAQAWVDLAKLYGDMGYEETALGIFNFHCGVSGSTLGTDFIH